jgi:hypothetical protein
MNVQVPKTEGEREVEFPEHESTAYNHSIKMLKVNVGMTENSKFVQIGDYWSDKIVEKIEEFLCEYHDLFPMTFLEMKEITRDIGEMNIPLKLGAKLVRHRPYRLNLKNKKTLIFEIDT